MVEADFNLIQTTSCNRRLHDFGGILHTMRLVVLNLSASWLVSLIVVAQIITTQSHLLLDRAISRKPETTPNARRID